MAVFTELSEFTLARYLAEVTEAKLLSVQSIGAGVENTTYRLQCAGHEAYYFTLFEQLSRPQAMAVVKFLRDCTQQGLKVQSPCLGSNVVGEHVTGHADTKPWVICAALPGASLVKPSAGEAMQIGKFLGELHQVSVGAEPLVHLSVQPWQQVFDELKVYKNQSALSLEAWGFFEAHLEIVAPVLEKLSDFPQVVGHGDLFVDNSLFAQGKLTGVIDFFNAYQGPRLYDLAVTLLAWCLDDEACWRVHHLRLLLAGYRKKVPLTQVETQYLPAWVRLAALRFWASRTLALVKVASASAPAGQYPGSLRVNHKSPEVFARYLNQSTATLALETLLE